MEILQILTLALVQGAAELLPVSSSAHVIVAEKLMGLDPTSPEMTLLLVMLHTGTMLAVIVYFWKSWIKNYFSSYEDFRKNVVFLLSATAVTGVVGLALQKAIKLIVAANDPTFEIESLFGNSRLMAIALAAAGVLIILSSKIKTKGTDDVSLTKALWIGAVQGLCLPFRGFSRSGATISTGLALGVARRKAEEFSFALAVILTPAVIVKEFFRIYKHVPSQSTSLTGNLLHSMGPGLIGMCLSFMAGLLALRWLSNWLEHGRWHFFGGYCIFASLVVLWVG